MTKQEFMDFCEQYFFQKGFVKKKKCYFRGTKEILCCIGLQKSIAEAFYVNYYFFIGDYEKVKKYPDYRDADTYNRLTVTSKTTMNGRFYSTAVIEYDLYSKEEIEIFFEQAFEKYIMPPIERGKLYLLWNLEHYVASDFGEGLPELLNKLDTQLY